ncbi:MAG TPA: zinc ribbon domain-containing protein [Nitrosopumilus sp.]|nr:zinc ribbon domain-containing protein [Nitrosopumilus sp.]
MTITDLNQLSVLIEVCTKLIKMRVGDKNKLQVIKARAELGRIIPQLDLKYVEKLMNYYDYSEPPTSQKPYQAPQSQKPYQAPRLPNASNSCNSCGAKIIDNNQFCTECGAQNTGVQQPPPQYQPQYPQQNYRQGGKPSAAYWLLPIFLQFVGGIIAWACIKNRDPRMAKNTLILGILLTVITPIVYFAIILGIASTIPFNFDI